MRLGATVSISYCAEGAHAISGFGATGSKMSDIIGDLDAIIDAKRHDTTMLFVTDGRT